MSNSGFAVDIHKVADTDRKVALFLGIAFLFVWVVAINIGVQDLAPRWFQREFDWMSNEMIPPIFLSMTFASLLAAAFSWAFSGHGDKLYHISAAGVERVGMFKSRVYRWADFEELERDVSKLSLRISPEARNGRVPNAWCSTCPASIARARSSKPCWCTTGPICTGSRPRNSPLCRSKDTSRPCRRTCRWGRAPWEAIASRPQLSRQCPIYRYRWGHRRLAAGGD